MQGHSRRIRNLAAAGVVAVAVVATGSAGSANTPKSTQPVAAKKAAQLVQLGSGRDGGETYVWIVEGAQRGMAFR